MKNQKLGFFDIGVKTKVTQQDEGTILMLLKDSGVSENVSVAPYSNRT
jgi:hypothetical protein